MQIFSALLVILPIVIAGGLSRKLKILSVEDLKGLSAFIYYFALPALFLEKIANLDLFTIDLNIFWGSVLPIVFCVGLLLLFKFLRIINKKWFVLLSLSVVFGSNAFFGVAFFEALKGQEGLDFMIISSSILGPIGIIVSLFLFEYATQKKQSFQYLLKILRNPLILSILIGIVFSLTKIKIDFLFSSLEMLGKTAGPTAIFTLGMFIYDRFKLENLRKAVLPVGFRLIVFPLITFLTLHFVFEITPKLTSFLFLQSGIPVAVSIFIFAERYQYETDLLSSLVILTSLGSFVILPLLFWIGG